MFKGSVSLTAACCAFFIATWSQGAVAEGAIALGVTGNVAKDGYAIGININSSSEAPFFERSHRIKSVGFCAAVLSRHCWFVGSGRRRNGDINLHAAIGSLLSLRPWANGKGKREIAGCMAGSFLENHWMSDGRGGIVFKWNLRWIRGGRATSLAGAISLHAQAEFAAPCGAVVTLGRDQRSVMRIAHGWIHGGRVRTAPVQRGIGRGILVWRKCRGK